MPAAACAGENAEQCRSAIGQSAQNLLAQLEQTGAARLQDIVAPNPIVVLTSCRPRSPAIRYSSADRRLLEQIVGLHHDFCRHAGDESLQDQVAFRRAQVGGAQANQIIRERGDVVRIEAIVAELREEGIVTRFAVFAFGFELGHRDRLGQLDHLRQPLAVRRDRVGALFEDKRIRLADADPFVAFSWPAERSVAIRSVESSPRTRWRRLSGIGTFGRGLSQHAGHRVEIESVSDAPHRSRPAVFPRSVPSFEWTKSALRMSDSFMISLLISARNFCAFWSCKTCQAC